MSDLAHGIEALAAGGATSEFAAGRSIPVAVKDIEPQLAKLWRAMADAGSDGKAQGKSSPVTRACLWNLVVRTPGGEAFTEAKKLIDDLSPAVPARVIVLSADTAAQAEPGVRAWVEANWHEAGGTRQIGSEEVTLEAKGPAVDDLASIVRALILPDVPVASIWHGVPPLLDGARSLDGELIAAADRLVLPRHGGEASLHAAGQIVARDGVGPGGQPREVISAAWLGSSRWRQLVASLFDPPTPEGEARAIRSVAIDCSTGNVDAALLFLGWLASRLGWSDGRRTGGHRYLFRRDAQEVEASISVGATAIDCFHKVALETPAGPYGVTRLDGEAVALETPTIARKQPRHCPETADLWIESLGTRGRDPLFVEALLHTLPLL